MTEQSKVDIDTMEKALAAATPGPWKWQGGDSKYRDLGKFIGADGFDICWFGNTATYYPTSGDEPDETDINLIAKAPTWLHQLIQEVKTNREEIERLASFAEKVIQTGFNGDVCGADIQDWGVTHELLREDSYDPEKHGEISDFETGDTIYLYTEIIKHVGI